MTQPPTTASRSDQQVPLPPQHLAEAGELRTQPRLPDPCRQHHPAPTTTASRSDQQAPLLPQQLAEAGELRTQPRLPNPRRQHHPAPHHGQPRALGLLGLPLAQIEVVCKDVVVDLRRGKYETREMEMS